MCNAERLMTCVGAEEMRAVLAARLGASDVPRPYDTAAEWDEEWTVDS